MTGREQKPVKSTRRMLTAEERELWQRVVRTVSPRKNQAAPEISFRHTIESGLASSHARGIDARSSGKASPVHKMTSMDQKNVPSKALPELVEFDWRERRKITRGRAAPGRVLDLHGMRQHQAHMALREFLREAAAEDTRLVLVITGKGTTEIPGVRQDQPGVLRRQVPHWLGEADLRDIVLSFDEAGAGHGGAGALYVRLRRRRSPMDQP